METPHPSLQHIEEYILPENSALVEKLLASFSDPSHLSDCVCYSNMEGGVSLRWSKARMFCEVDQQFWLTLIPHEPATFRDVVSFTYGRDAIDLVHEKIVQVLEGVRLK